MTETNAEGHVFSEKGHVHKFNGKRLTGVTTVLGVLNKPYLIPWAANTTAEYIEENYPKCLDSLGAIDHSKFETVLKESRLAWKIKRDSAGDKGKDVHSQIEEIIKQAIAINKGYLVTLTSGSRQVKNFINWAISRRVKFLASEKLVHSKELWIGGICDFICEIDGKRVIGDIKTGKVIDPSYYWQVSAYDYCLNEMGEGLAENYVIIRLGKDEMKDGKIIKEGSFEVGENFSFKDNIEGFKSALTIYRKMKLLED